MIKLPTNMGPARRRALVPRLLWALRPLPVRARRRALARRLRSDLLRRALLALPLVRVLHRASARPLRSLLARRLARQRQPLKARAALLARPLAWAPRRALAHQMRAASVLRRVSARHPASEQACLVLLDHLPALPRPPQWMARCSRLVPRRVSAPQLALARLTSAASVASAPLQPQQL